MVKSDRFAKPEEDYAYYMAERKGACGYRVQMSCANCQHVINYRSLCKKHRFPVNRDHGICDDFKSFAAGWQPQAAVAGRPPYRGRRTKSITRKSK